MSRQPPLPPGLPPRPSFQPQSPHGAHNGDSYRPQETNYYRQDDNRRPSQQYQFRGDSGRGNGYNNDYDSRPSYNSRRSRSPPRSNHFDTYRPRDDRREDNFTFRYDAPPGVDYSRTDNYRPRSPPPPPRSMYPEDIMDRNKPRDSHRRPFPRNERAAHGHGRGGLVPRGGARGRGGPRRASERAFLKTNRGPTPELMQGIDEDTNNGTRFKALGDLSDSDEADMSVSEDENESEQPKKKQARMVSKAADGDSVPRWSNPDPYTALPPPDESQRKKKDVVKLIRKARNTDNSDGVKKVEAETDDFISFDFGDDDIKIDDNQTPKVGSYGIPPKGAPTGPRNTQEIQPPPPSSPPLPTEPSLPNKPAFSTASKPKAFIDLTSDSALGNRKRTIRDEIKGPLRGPPNIYSSSNKRKSPSDGRIDRKWQVEGNSSGTPWVSAGIDHSNTANMGLWLHKEIMDFYHYVKPRAFEQTIRAQLVANLRSAVNREFHGFDILPFGSFPAGLYLPTSDMDLVCVSDGFMRTGRPNGGNQKKLLYNFAAFLDRSQTAISGSVQTIAKAKVPIVKYQDKLTGLRVDVSFENDTGLIANKTFQEWKVEFPAMPIIVTVIKHILAMRGLNEPQHGGIGGFSVICLVVSLLQHMPQVQSRSMIAEHHLGEILMEFFDLYGNRFNVSTTAISLKPPAYVSKNQVRNITYKTANKNAMEKFSIIDPNRSDNDISGGASNTRTILQCFSTCYRDLQQKMAYLRGLEKREKASILGCILAGNYNSFELQRSHLAYVHEELVGPIED